MNASDPFALGGLDPLIALGAEQERLVAQMNAPGQVDDVTEAESDELFKIEDQICALVPISAAGAVVLLRFLKYRMKAFAWSEADDRIADNLIAGLERLGAREGAW
jgi:hypothetical protein